MSRDYLDILLDRATGAVPLAEPRIGPAALGSSMTVAWEEVSEENVHPTGDQRTRTQENSKPLQQPLAPPPSHLPSVEGLRNPELPPSLHLDELQTFSSPHAAPRLQPAPSLSDTGQIQPVTEGRSASPPGEPSGNPATRLPVSRTAQSVAESRPAEREPKRIDERGIQTQRWFPGPTSIKAGQTGDRLITASPAPAQPQDLAPISIRIDRIEVRAGLPAAPAVPAIKPRATAPLGLDDYLKRRSGGGR